MAHYVLAPALLFGVLAYVYWHRRRQEREVARSSGIPYSYFASLALAAGLVVIGALGLSHGSGFGRLTSALLTVFAATLFTILSYMGVLLTIEGKRRRRADASHNKNPTSQRD